MRFITEDTNKGDVKDPLSLNLYTYCQGNPVNLVDTDGHAPKMLNNDGGFIGAGYGGGGGVFLLWAMNMATKLPPDTFEDLLNLAYDVATGDYKSAAIDATLLAVNDGINFRIGKSTPQIDINIKPIATNRKLQNIIENLYKGQNSNTIIGNGTTMDSIRYELKTGKPVGGKFHSIKGQESINGLKNLLKAGGLSSEDEAIINTLIKDLENALNGK